MCSLFVHSGVYLSLPPLPPPRPSSGLLRLVLQPKLCNVLKTASPLQAKVISINLLLLNRCPRCFLSSPCWIKRNVFTKGAFCWLIYEIFDVNTNMHLQKFLTRKLSGELDLLQLQMRSTAVARSCGETQQWVGLIQTCCASFDPVVADRGASSGKPSQTQQKVLFLFLIIIFIVLILL